MGKLARLEDLKSRALSIRDPVKREKVLSKILACMLMVDSIPLEVIEALEGKFLVMIEKGRISLVLALF